MKPQGFSMSPFSLVMISALVASTIFSFFGCTDGHAKIIEIDRWMSRIQFDQSGQHLFVLTRTPIATPDGPSPYELVRNNITVFDVGTWKKVYSYISEHETRATYSCADPDVLIHTEDSYPDDDYNDLVFRSISTGEEINRIGVGAIPPGQSSPGMYHCDMEDNIAYFYSRDERIRAINGSTGELLREYLVTGDPGTSSFRVQKGGNRLVRVDENNDLVWIFNLATAELLARLDLWETYRNGLWTMHIYPDDQTLVYGVMAERDGSSGLFLIVVDLDAMTIKDEIFVGHYLLTGFDPMPPDGSRIVLGLQEPSASCIGIWGMALDGSPAELLLDLCDFGWAGAFLIPELSLLLVSDWAHPSGAESYFIAYSYPDFNILAEGPAPSAYTEKNYVPNLDLEVMTSTFNDHFGVYDLRQYKLVDDFFVCHGLNNTSVETLKVDPLGRWAAMICGGEDRGIEPGKHPVGAGFAIVDLSRYRKTQ